MIIDGEKWACEACVRGHRVSNCNHSDRPLQHINRKGRPVSQCQHCRSMRKSRSAHVKCDCGEKTHKCPHLQGTVEGHKESCCCNHGGRCTCAHKKEQQPHLDTVPESDSESEDATPSSKSTSKGSVRRRRANTTHSEGTLAFDENGRHKPTYKHAKPSQKCGPYQIKRVNSLHSAGSMSNRSADSLVTSDSCSSATGSSQSAPLREQRKVKSEAASPLLKGASFGHLGSQPPPLDLSSIEYPPYTGNGFDVYPGDRDQSLFSATLSAGSVDWSHYDLDFNNRSAENFAPSSYSQTQSFGGFDFSGSEQAPTLTTATSGDVSEAEDFMGNTLDEYDTNSAFGRTSTTSSGFNLAPAQANLSSLSYEELRGFMKAGTKFLPTPASLASDEPSLVAIPNAGGASGYAYADDDTALWMADYGSGLPTMTDSPGPSMAPFWDGQ